MEHICWTTTSTLPIYIDHLAQEHNQKEIPARLERNSRNQRMEVIDVEIFSHFFFGFKPPVLGSRNETKKPTCINVYSFNHSHVKIKF